MARSEPASVSGDNPQKCPRSDLELTHDEDGAKPAGVVYGDVNVAWSLIGVTHQPRPWRNSTTLSGRRLMPRWPVGIPDTTFPRRRIVAWRDI